MNPESNHHERLFFALWPDDLLRQQMQQRLSAIQGIPNQGRLVSPDNLHMTIHFLGNIECERIDCFIQQAKLISLKPFELHLDRAGYFRQPRVFWLGCELVPDRLLQLHYELAIALKKCGYIAEDRKYHPHVTMARKITKPVIEQPIASINWYVDEFVLVRSISQATGVQYQVRNRFGK